MDIHGLAFGPTADYSLAYEQMVKNSELSSEDPGYDVVLDQRALGRWVLRATIVTVLNASFRYEATVPEPRAGLPSGHIPNSLPCPFVNYLAPATEGQPYTSFRPLSELKGVLVDAVGGEGEWEKLASGDRGLVFTCGSGMSAAVGWLANEVVRAEEGGMMKSAIYDEVSEVCVARNTETDETVELDRVCQSRGE